MTTPPDNPREPIGLLAGWGRFPIVVAEALRREGRPTFCLGIVGEADAALAGLCDGFHWVGLAKLGRAIRYFKRHGIREATMAGKFHKITLFQPGAWIRFLPDWRMLRAAIPHFITRRKDCRDDSLLGMVVHEFAADGIRFQPATDYAPQLLIPPGQLTRRGPSPWQWKDIEFGWSVAKQMGGLDVGQSVAVKDQTVLAVEAIEGTDGCIRRAGSLCQGGAFLVVKVAKPQQDMRFDVPTIGIDTVRTMVESRAKVLAVEARKTIFLDQTAVIDFADRNKLVIVALEDGKLKAES
jgi:UDP-2,3-diacylglucosamine hydrolase